MIQTIDSFLKQEGSWVFPVILLLIQFIYKLVVCDRPNGEIFWRSLLQSPVDVGFLSISLIIASIIISSASVLVPFTVFCVYLVLIVFSIGFWKFSPLDLTGRAIAISGILLLLNFLLTITMLVFAIKLLN